MFVRQSLDQCWTDSPGHCDQTHLTMSPMLTISYLKGVSMRSVLNAKGSSTIKTSGFLPPPNPKAILQAAELMKPSFQQLSLHGLSVS